MIPNIPDFYEYAYGVVWFLVGRRYAGNAYRKEVECLKKYEQLTSRQKNFKDKPMPVVESTAAFVLGGGLWPAFLGWRIGEAFTNANEGRIHAAKRGISEALKFVFLGRRPRAERRRIEIEKLKARNAQLEKELELNG